MVLRGDALNAETAIAVTFPAGDGQTVPHDDFTGIGIADLNEQLVLLYFAVELDLPV